MDMSFWIYVLIGMASGIFIFPIFLGIYVLIKNTLERRKIKRLLKQGKFLVTIDSRDYDVKAWTGQKYGNIDNETEKIYLENLNNKIFKIAKKLKNQDDFNKLVNYLNEARKIGYTDEQITNIFKSKNYPMELINKIFENG